MPKKSQGREKAISKMKAAAKEYRAYKKKNPNGSKKITTFVKDQWKK